MKNLNIARRTKTTSRDKDRARYQSLQRQHEYCLNTAAHWRAEGNEQIAANWMKDAEKVAKKLIKMSEIFDEA